MASSADIETTLMMTVNDIVHPAAGPLLPNNITIMRGWPTEADVRKAVANKAHMIGIYAVAGMSRDITKTMRAWQDLGGGVSAMEVGRIEQLFRLQIWASSRLARDTLLGALLPPLKFQLRYPLPDGTVATLMKLEASGPNDQPARADEWAQNIDLMFQYPVIYTQTQPIVTQITQTTTIDTGLTLTTQTPPS